MLAVMSRDKDTVTAVLEASAKPGLVDCLGKTAEWHAVSVADNVAGELQAAIQAASKQWEEQEMDMTEGQ